MKHMVWIFGILVFSRLFFGGAAMGDARPEESQKPYEMMQKYAPLVGKWTMDQAQTKDNGKTWTSYPQSMIEISFKQKGLLLEERPLNSKKSGFHLAIFTSYDQYQGTYRQAAIEDYWGLMDISEGQLVGDNIVFTNTKSKTYYPMEDGRLRALKLTVELKSPTRFIYIDQSYDDGKSWSQLFKIKYQKIP